MTSDQLREAVARLYIDKWGVSDYGLASAAIAIVVEEMARVAETTNGSVRRGNIDDALYIPPSAKDAAAAIRAYGRRDEANAAVTPSQ